MANEFKVKKGLVVNGSGSVILDIQGSQGQLFSVTDQLSGSLFSVNDISGMSILAVSSDDSVKLGTFSKEAIKVSGSNATITGSFTGSLSGSLFGTASWANNATTSSYILNAVSASFASTASFVTNAFVQGGNSFGTTALLGTNDVRDLQFETSGSVRITIGSSGNVGVGTTSPNSLFSVFTNSATIPRVGRFVQANSGVSTIGALQSVNAAAGGSAIDAGHWTESATDWIFRGYGNVSRAENDDVNGSGAVFKFGITAAGNVGINTRSPNARLDVSGSAIITGSLTVTQGITGSLFGTSSWATNALTSSYILNAISASFASQAANATTASYVLNAVSSSFATTASSADNFLVRGTLTAQTIVAQVITSSTDFVTGSTRFGTLLINTHQFTGSVGITGSLAVNGSNVILSNQTSSMSVATASYVLNAISASFASTSSNVLGGATNYIPLWNSNTTLSSSVMYQSSSNIGIGTTSPQRPLEVLSNSNNFVSVGVNQISVGAFTGIHFGYRESNNLYRKSAIVFERTDLTLNNAQGKIHILNGPQTDANNATLSDAKLTVAENGNIGIGITSPTSKLHVSGTTGGVFEVDVASAATALYVSASGNIGIGTTTPAVLLDLYSSNGGVSFKTYTSTTDYTEHTYSKDAGFFIDSYQSVAGSPYTKTADLIANADSGAQSQMRFFTATTVSNPTERMRITSGGNLLVGGTNDSGEKLVVSGTMKVTGASSFGGNMTADFEVARLSLGVQSGTGDAHVGASGVASPTVGNQDYGYYIAHNAYRQSDGAWKHSRTSTIPAVRHLGSGGVSSGTAGFYWDYSANVGTSNITWTNLMQLSTSGNLGIGTTTPNILTWNKALTLNNASGNVAYELSINNVAQAYLSADTSNVILGAYANIPLLFRTNNTTRLTIASDGNVGIGTTSPTLGTLQVNGNVYANSFTGSLSGSAISASYASASTSASYASSSTSASFATTSSYVLQAVSASFASTASSADNFLVRGTLTAQTIVVQTITSSVDFVTGSTRFGSLSSDTHVFTGSLNISGSITVSGSVINDLTASFAQTASFVTTAQTASFVTTAQTASFVQNAQTASYILQAVSASFATLAQTANTASYVVTAQTASFVTTAQTASYVLQAISASFSSTASSVNTLNQNVSVNGGVSASSYLYSTVDVTAQQNLRSVNSSGDEGGEIFLNKAVTNTTLNGGVTIDVWQNRLRFFEQGGTARGYYIDISNGGAGVGTNLVGGGGSTTPGGSNTQIQYNNSNAFGGVPTLTYDGTTLRATGSFSGSLVGALTGTASFATQAVTSSYANATATTGYTIGGSQIYYTTVLSSTSPSTVNVFTNNTGSFVSAFYNYTLYSGSNARAGQISAVWVGNTVSYNDYSTTDIENTLAVTGSVAIVTGQVQLNFQVPSSTAGWNIKATATYI